MKFKIILSVLLLANLAIVGCDTAQEEVKTENTSDLFGDEIQIDEHAHDASVHAEIDEQAKLDWCYEHSVPESVCTKCNPSLIGGFKETGDWCGGHDLPESHCRLCNPGIEFPQEIILRQRAAESSDNEISVSLFFRPNKDICATNDALIQFASVTTAERAGLSVETVRGAKQEQSISAPAETIFDETNSIHISSTVKAMVTKWLKSPGDLIQEGEVLAILQSPEIAELKSSLVSKVSRYQVQKKELERHEELKSRNLISDSDYDLQKVETEQAKAEMISLEGLLLSAGLNRSDIDDIKEFGAINNSFALRAPSSGMLVERYAQLGKLLEEGNSFAMLADPREMWIEAKLTEEQLRSVEKGQKLYFSSDGLSLNAVGGEIIWISRLLDQHTRTGTVRAKILDPEHRLQANEFGRVSIPIHSDNAVTLVPKDAVQWEGCCNVVFVKETVDRYRPRKVNLLDGEGPYYQVSQGLMQGEQIVVDGAFLLKTELKKSSIGAGCCGIEPAG